MIFHLRKYIHYFTSIKNKYLLKGLLFVLCVVWLLIRSFNQSSNELETRNQDFPSDKDQYDFFYKTELEMLRRKEVVKNVCSREGLGIYKRKGVSIRHPPVPNYEAYFFDLDNKLMWCPVYKSASTSWLYNLCNLGGITDDYLDNTDVLVVKIARNIYPSLSYKTAVDVVKDKLKFFIVRHPFDRLLSAYRDKLEKVTLTTGFHESQFYYKKYGKRIVDKYRQFSTYGNEKEILLNVEKDVDTKEISLSHRNSSRLEPTFEEFVLYLIDIDLSLHADEHWIPYYIYCTPCLIDYDVIAKFETLDNDQRYILEKSNLQEKLTPKWKRKTKGGLSSSTAKNYFSTISRDLLLKLYGKFRIDFELFEYDIEEYLTYVR